MIQRLYFDYNASAPLLPCAREALCAALSLHGNPSSIHAEGRAAKFALEEARAKIAGLLHVSPRMVTFTSGGTEAAHLALTPAYQTSGSPYDLFIVGAGEHPCVVKGHRFPVECCYSLPLLSSGIADLVALDRILEQNPHAKPILALQSANNETGILQPIQEAAQKIHTRGGLVICDAVQTAGRLPFSPTALGIDVLFLSAHKMGGPKGIGALVRLREDLHIVQPFLQGGGQEQGLRSGTESVALAAGFAEAFTYMHANIESEVARIQILRDKMEAYLRDIVPNIVIFGEHAPRLPNTIAFSIPGFAASLLVMTCDLAGIALSSGSACSSGKIQPSAVLTAMSVSKEITKGALRLSLGWGTRAEDITAFCERFSSLLSQLKARRASR